MVAARRWGRGAFAWVVQSILSYNGSAVIAMCGKNCVGIACDRRFGIQQQTLSNDFDKVFKINDKLFIGLPGLVTDMQTLYVRRAPRLSCGRRRRQRKERGRRSRSAGVRECACVGRCSYEKLRYRVNVYRLKEEREIKPRNFAKVVSSLLYEHRYVRADSEVLCGGCVGLGPCFDLRAYGLELN